MIRAVTIDYWNTIFDTANGAGRRRFRDAAVQRVFDEIGVQPDAGRIDAAREHVRAVFDHRWRNDHRTMNADENLRVFWDALGLTVTDVQHQRTVEAFEESIMHGLPNLLPGAAQAIRTLARSHALAVISDTSYSPGTVLRRVLQVHDLHSCFGAMVFSDETGVSKPHPVAFRAALEPLGVRPEEAVHIGDIERTDIAGATAMGMHAILLRLDTDSEFFNEHDGTSAADAVVASWPEAMAVINHLHHR